MSKYASAPDIASLLTNDAVKTWHARLAELVSHASSMAFPQHLASLLNDVIAYDTTVVVVCRQSDPPILLYDDYPVSARAYSVENYLDHLYSLDPFFIALNNGLSCGVHSLDSLTQRGFQRSTYYQHYYKDLGLTDEIGVFLPVTPEGETLFISLGMRENESMTGASTATFTHAHKHVLEHLLPMISALVMQYWHSLKMMTQREERLSVRHAFETFGNNVLTRREQEVARLLLQGHSTKTIARVLDVQCSTIKVHRKNIHARMNISTQSQLFWRFLHHLEHGVHPEELPVAH